jgi:hypothetical protein
LNDEKFALSMTKIFKPAGSILSVDVMVSLGGILIASELKFPYGTIISMSGGLATVDVVFAPASPAT